MGLTLICYSTSTVNSYEHSLHEFTAIQPVFKGPTVIFFNGEFNLSFSIKIM